MEESMSSLKSPVPGVKSPGDHFNPAKLMRNIKIKRDQQQKDIKEESETQAIQGSIFGKITDFLSTKVVHKQDQLNPIIEEVKVDK
mmetsp:Transcript_36496/g.56034  ORF Transcript_36496/g.56034 Transcript_36496/m.56034 type:complete len:86 (-) Transcript_36496:41-298(-)